MGCILQAAVELILEMINPMRAGILTHERRKERWRIER
jgi:hypothetical protein